MNLGDAIPGGGSDVLYTGETGDSMLSMQYYRNKAREFQDVLNALDAGRVAAMDAIAADIDEQLTSDLYAMLDEFDAKRLLLRGTAEAINAGAAIVNAAGGRFPQLSIPTGLGILPAIPVAALAAIGTAATLIVWGTTWLRGLNDRLRLAQQLAAIEDPERKAALAASIAQSDNAIRAAETPPLASIANIVKWVAIAGVAWVAYSAFTGRKALT